MHLNAVHISTLRHSPYKAYLIENNGLLNSLVLSLRALGIAGLHSQCSKYEFHWVVLHQPKHESEHASPASAHAQIESNAQTASAHAMTSCGISGLALIRAFDACKHPTQRLRWFKKVFLLLFQPLQEYNVTMPESGGIAGNETPVNMSVSDPAYHVNRSLSKVRAVLLCCNVETSVEQNLMASQDVFSVWSMWKASHTNKGHAIFNPNAKSSLSVRFSVAGICWCECEHNLLALFVFVCDCSCRPCSCIRLPFVQRLYQRPCSNTWCGNMYFKACCMKRCHKYKSWVRCLNCWSAG